MNKTSRKGEEGQSVVPSVLQHSQMSSIHFGRDAKNLRMTEMADVPAPKGRKPKTSKREENLYFHC